VVTTAIYHGDEDEGIISPKTSRDACPREDAQTNNTNDECIKNRVDYQDAVASGFGVDVVGRRPTLNGLYRDIHRASEQEGQNLGQDLGLPWIHMYVDKRYNVKT